MKRAAAAKTIAELSAAELRAEIEHLCGLPCPPDGAPVEMWEEHEVAANFLLAMRGANDVAAAKAAAAEFTLRNAIFPIERLRPHIERAMGRKLLDSEVEQRAIFA